MLMVVDGGRSTCKVIGVGACGEGMMQLPEIILAEPQNGVFEELKVQWQAQLEKYGLSLSDYSAPFLRHADEIVNSRSGKDYSLACVRSRVEGGFIALFHANRARLPGTVGETLRVVWVLPSPKYDSEDVRSSEMAELAAGIIWGALELANGPMRSNEVKIHLQGIGDRKFVTAMALSLPFTDRGISVETRGNWLHISGLNAEE